MTLVIMAAGMGSRFGGGIKQLTPIGPNGELIIDYSVHDAIAAGFNKIVFIIRKDIEQDFKDVIGDRIAHVCEDLGVEVAYAFQEMSNVPNGVVLPVDRKKPWGTGHAVLAAKDIIDGPFVVINADDYYGKHAFISLNEHLKTNNTLCMAGYLLKNTLSKNGGVTRGICNVDKDLYLNAVDETCDIIGSENCAISNGKQISLNSFASMNMWGLTPEFMGLLEDGFVDFFANIEGKELTAEYLLPIIIGDLLKERRVQVKVLPTPDAWFGVTYKEDQPLVTESIKDLIATGVYSRDLYSDLKQYDK